MMDPHPEKDHSAGLKLGVAKPFPDLLQAWHRMVQVATLWQHQHRTQMSNVHAEKHTLVKDCNCRLHAHDWKNMTTHVHLSIALVKSLSLMDGGGCRTCFRKSKGQACDQTICETKGFAHKHVKMWKHNKCG